MCSAAQSRCSDTKGSTGMQQVRRADLLTSTGWQIHTYLRILGYVVKVELKNVHS